MRYDIVTLFPELFSSFLATSFVAHAIDEKYASVRFESPRNFGLGKHRAVDDTPYGGGAGMVMRVDCLVAAMESLDASAEAAALPKARRVLLTPQGQRFDQKHAQRLSETGAVMMICGRYEGFDERVRHFVDEEMSLGDFVMTGGEVAAMAIIEATVRLVPGVLGNHASVDEESHSPANVGLLEYPQFTRPVTYRDLTVPDILLTGHHANIAAWRRTMSRERTQLRRPDIPLPELPAPKQKRKRTKKTDED